MSEPAPQEYTTVLAQLNWAGFTIWRDFCREEYKQSFKNKWSTATIERWFVSRFYNHFTSRLRPGRYYEFSAEEFARIFQGNTTITQIVREWSHPDMWDMYVPYIDRELPPVHLFGDVQYV